MSEQEVVVVEAQAPAAPEPVLDAAQLAPITDEQLVKLKAKKGTAPRYMISWRLLDALIARMEQAERRLADE